MKKLIKGIVDFRQKSLAAYREKFSTLALGQNPDTLFIACCDSRVVPNTFASSDPGDLFVVRNIGNLVPPCHHHTPEEDTSVAAAIEFSILTLNVSDVVICGHSDCGAMRPFLASQPTNMPAVNSWLRHATPSYERFLKFSHIDKNLSQLNALSQCNVIQQIEHLKTYPIVQERMQSHQIRLHGWWFDLATADVHYLSPETHNFVLIDNDEAEHIFATL